MGIRAHQIIAFAISLVAVSATAQNSRVVAPIDYAALCDQEQLRLDMIDGKKDTALVFNTADQKKRGRDIYFTRIDQIQANLAKPTFPTAEKEYFYRYLHGVLQGLNKNNVRYLAYFDHFFGMVESLSLAQGAQKDLELLKNNVPMALDCIPYFLKRSHARDVMVFAATKKPYDVLTKYADYSQQSWFLEVLETVARNDPNAVKQYFGTQHTVNYALKTSKDPVVIKLYDIYTEYGRTSSCFTNIELVYNNKLSIEESEELVQKPNDWFSKLCILRRSNKILGSYSVDQELGFHSLNIVRKVNLLHDEKDDIRFAIVKNNSAEELYNLMVYSKDEIFTSSFLGMFKRLMQRRKDSSMYVFFENVGFNKFRTFIQMCAGYNTMQKLLNTMSVAEKNMLLDEIVKDLEKTGGNLEPAVEVADIYGSITDSLLRENMSAKLGEQLKRCFLAGNTYGARLYGLLYKFTGKDPEVITGKSIAFDIPVLEKVDKDLLFPDGKNIQQHVFYDDEDGEAAYNGFLLNFKTDKNYKITDMVSYVKIETVVGKKIILYCNKPKNEKGLDALRKLFETSNRYPDIVVHRGHSYHLSTTIDLLTNNAKVAVLGSCGGYLNISKILDNASDAQIVSSKQVGTWTVNNVLLKDMCEMMRKGNGEIDWKTLWKGLDVKLKNNDKWGDYIPPYRNLGVRFVKAFERI